MLKFVTREGAVKIETPLQAGEWATIKVENDPHHCNVGFNEIIVRTIQGKNIQAEIEYEGELHLNKRETDALHTYPAENALFDENNLIRKSGSVQVFRTRYGTHRNRGDLKLPTLDFYFSNIPDSVKERHIKVSDMADEIGKNIAIMHNSLEGLIRDLFGFVRSTLSGSERKEYTTNRPFEFYYSLPHILQEYFDLGQFSGDCKCVYTFAVGVANAMGMPARGVEGIVVIGSKKRVVGHYWPELYIPTGPESGFWVPIDPANSGFNTFMAFSPHKLVEYHTWEFHLKFRGPNKARIRISYV